MENYQKGEVKQVEDVIPFVFEENCIHMNVNNGSKPSNLIGFALKSIKDEKRSQISWFGKGNALYKTISCAQILKSKVKGLHRLCYIRYIRTEEYWEPKHDMLERLKVNIDIPAITILLSKTPVETVEEFTTPKELQELLNKALIERDSDKKQSSEDKKSRPTTGTNKQKSKQNNKANELGTPRETLRNRGRNSENDTAVSNSFENVDVGSGCATMNINQDAGENGTGVRHKSTGGGMKYERGYSNDQRIKRQHRPGYGSKYSNKDRRNTNERKQESYNDITGDVSESGGHNTVSHEDQIECEHGSAGFGENHENGVQNRTNSERGGRNYRQGSSRSRGNSRYERNSYNSRDNFNRRSRTNSDNYEHRRNDGHNYEHNRDDNSGHTYQSRRGRGNSVSNRGNFRRYKSSTMDREKNDSYSEGGHAKEDNSNVDVPRHSKQQSEENLGRVENVDCNKFENVKEE